MLQPQTNGAAEKSFEDVAFRAHAVVVMHVLNDTGGIRVLYKAPRDHSIYAVEFRDVSIVGRPFLIPGAVNQNNDPFHTALAFPVLER